jgi:hypothetical protein
MGISGHCHHSNRRRDRSGHPGVDSRKCFVFLVNSLGEGTSIFIAMKP